MDNKYLNIEIAGENNIGVIDLGKGVVDYKNINSDKTTQKIKRVVEKKLVTALESHFDCPVKIRLTEVISITPPIRAKVFVVIEGDDCDHQEEVALDETWVY